MLHADLFLHRRKVRTQEHPPGWQHLHVCRPVHCRNCWNNFGQVYSYRVRASICEGDDCVHLPEHLCFRHDMGSICMDRDWRDLPSTNPFARCRSIHSFQLVLELHHRRHHSVPCRHRSRRCKSRRESVLHLGIALLAVHYVRFLLRSRDEGIVPGTSRQDDGRDYADEEREVEAALNFRVRTRIDREGIERECVARGGAPEVGKCEREAVSQ